jgi:hypothetical protein
MAAHTLLIRFTLNRRNASGNEPHALRELAAASAWLRQILAGGSNELGDRENEPELTASAKLRQPRNERTLSLHRRVVDHRVFGFLIKKTGTALDFENLGLSRFFCPVGGSLAQARTEKIPLAD